jgi:hypothetical protein
LDLDINLQGKWKFTTGDNLNYKNNNFVDHGWNEIFVPSYWENQGYNHYDGYAWYRKTFVMDKNLPGETLILMLGKIDDIDELYINGKLVGNTGFFNLTHSFQETWKERRGYYFPKSLLNQNGKNTIAVRVFDYGGEAVYMKALWASLQWINTLITGAVKNPAIGSRQSHKSKRKGISKSLASEVYWFRPK